MIRLVATYQRCEVVSHAARRPFPLFSCCRMKLAPPHHPRSSNHHKSSSQFSSTSLPMPRAPHNRRGCNITPAVPERCGYDHYKDPLIANVRGFLSFLHPSTYHEMTPKIEFWIETIIKEGFLTAKGLAEQFSEIAWWNDDRNAEIPWLLKEFCDAVEQAQVYSIYYSSTLILPSSRRGECC